MKILVDMHWFDQPQEGVQTFLYNLYKELLEIAPNSLQFVFAASDIDHLKEVFGTRGNLSFVSYRKPKTLYRLFIDLPRIIKEQKPDVVHTQYLRPFPCKCRQIVTIHDVLFEDFPQYFSWKYRVPRHVLFGIAARHSDLVTTVSQYSRERIAFHYGLTERDISITPNGVSREFINSIKTSQFNPGSKHGVRRYLLYVSRKEPRKNHVTLLRAFYESQLWQQGVSLVNIGKTSIAIPEYTAYLAQLPDEVRKMVLDLEYTPFDELAGWYKNAAAFVFPSLAEGFGIPALEAYLAGIPTLCSRNTAMKEFTFFNENYFDPCDAGELKLKLLKVITESNHPPAEDEIEKFSWQHSAKVFLKLLEKSLFKECKLN